MYTEELFEFIDKARSVYHCVDNIKAILNKENYQELKENEKWNLTIGGKYYVVRDGASVIAFNVGKEKNSGFHIVASHLDSPTYKLKPNGTISSGQFKKLNTEPYGGMLASTWFDKPLSLAGRVMVKTENGVEMRLIDMEDKNIVIPSLAIHLIRNAAPQDLLNPQNDLLPVYGLNDTETSVDELISKYANVKENEKVLSHDLFLYNKEKGCVGGFDNELIMAPKLDDLECAYTSLKALLNSNEEYDYTNVCCIFDNEEVGSGTNHGAASSFLTDVLERINTALDNDKYISYSKSMLLSADNAHAVHPAHPEKSDPTNNVKLNKGVVVKYHSAFSYTTEAVSASIFKALCDKVNVPYQDYTNRSDLRGGSTLGRIQLEKLSITACDIGLAQLAMHSSYETAGTKDIEYMVTALTSFYGVNFKINDTNIEL